MNKIKTLIIASAVASASSAMALPIINGDIIFAGEYQTDNSSLLDATKFTAFNNVQVLGASTGSYAPVPANYGAGAGESVTYNTFTFDPVGASLPINPLWTFETGGVTYSFALTSLAVDTRTATGIHLIGSGLAHVDGFDDTPGSWDLSIGTVGKFHFSAGNAVPDGGATAVFLGAGIIGLGLLRRRTAE
jgi:hypothetical protein